MRLVFPWDKHQIEIVGEAASGEKALAFMQNNPIHLLITDITMPGMSGMELFSRVRELYPTVKVVILTCHQDFEYIQEALRMGAVDYIVKTQLEKQNLDQILERIVKAMVVVPPQISLEIQPEAYSPASSEKWNRVSWVLDDAEFQELTRTLGVALNHPAPQWSRNWMDAVEKWKMSFPMYPDWSSYSIAATSEELFHNMKQLRTGIQAWLRRSKYTEEVIHSIVSSLDFMHNSSNQHLSQSYVSDQVNLSKSYFSKSFKEILGISFIHYLQLASMNVAKEMLLNTNHPIYWVAEQCGFMDQRYFSKIFKDQTGMLPSEFRLHNS
nr:response regulator [Cohnella sp. WQ 127256]